MSIRAVCPICRGMLRWWPGAAACDVCGTAFPQTRRPGIDLLPPGGAEGGDGRLPHADAEARHPGDPPGSAAAIRGIEDDFAPLAPILALLRGDVLDLGGGPGIARHYLPAEARHVLFDPSPTQRPVDWEELAGHFPGRARTALVARGAAHALPFADRSFDAALAVRCLEGAGDPIRVGHEAARVLRPGGRLVVVLAWDGTDAAPTAEASRRDPAGDAADAFADALAPQLRLVHRRRRGTRLLLVFRRRPVPGGSAPPGPGLTRRLEVIAGPSRAASSGGLRGHIDLPSVGASIDGPVVEVIGWALGATAPVERVEARVGADRLRTAPVGTLRPDLAQAFPERPHAATAGFRLLLPAAEAADAGEVALTALTATGERLPLGAVAVRSHWSEADAPPDPLGLSYFGIRRFADASGHTG